MDVILQTGKEKIILLTLVRALNLENLHAFKFSSRVYKVIDEGEGGMWRFYPR